MTEVNTTTLPYYNPRLKMRWAKHHLDLLDREIRDYLGCDPYSISFEDDLEAGEHIVKLAVESLPDRVGLILGDFVCCLRTSLDHLANALTHCLGGVPNDSASFPIIDLNNSGGRKSFHRATDGIPPCAITVIESFQPYNYGQAYKSTKLWLLHRLWNIDKHRRIPFHATRAAVTVRGPSDMPPLEGWSNKSGIVRFPLAAKGQIHLDPAVQIGVEFGDENEGIIVPHEELIEIYDFVHNHVMPRFDSFFK